MKFTFTIFFVFISLFSFSQSGKIKLDLTIADTNKPYSLEIYVNKKLTTIKRTTVTKSGTYTINELEEGYYNLKLFSFNSTARSLKIDSLYVNKGSAINLTVTYPLPCKYNYPKDYIPKCPYNHVDKIVRILYGKPGKEMINKAQKGEIHLGGCMVSDCDPHFYCTIHKLEL
ncbi:hypothetical protein [Ferruginibacter sp. SUN106]|uniref:hypothetical protein n=1 Tax=Ferruginibacter sp. SUN106 TaxID=2978348 RepID=UPI003D3653F3